MQRFSFKLILSSIIIFLFSCNDNTPPFGSGDNTQGIDIDGISTVDAMNLAIEEKGVTVSENPLFWTEEELSILDVAGDKKVVGLGQAISGSAEFFKANSQIFKYLVENHNYKILVTKTDIGESYLINEAVLEGRTEDIEILMKEKMLVWSWQTEELKDLLEWMCEYNKGKPMIDRLMYMGNSFHSFDLNSGLIKKYLYENSTYVHDAFRDFLVKYVNYNEEVDFFDIETKEIRFQEVIAELDNTISKYENDINPFDQANDLDLYSFYHRMLLMLKESIIFDNNYPWPNYSHPLLGTDAMTEQIKWISDYYEGRKIVYWANNTDISEVPGSVGNLLNQAFLDDYLNIGYSFSKGHFNASFYSRGIVVFQIKSNDDYSLDGMFSRYKKSFLIKIQDLLSNSEWNTYFSQSVQYVSIKDIYNPYYPGYYYSLIEPNYFDYMIHFDNTTPTNLLSE